MGMTEIAARYHFKCDVCGESHFQETTRRPKHWSELKIARHAYDHLGAAYADAVSRLLCRECSDQVASVISSWAETRKGKGEQ